MLGQVLVWFLFVRIAVSDGCVSLDDSCSPSCWVVQLLVPFWMFIRFVFVGSDHAMFPMDTNNAALLSLEMLSLVPGSDLHRMSNLAFHIR